MEKRIKLLIKRWPICLILVIVIVIGWWWCYRPVTTVLLVRHAEKTAQSGDPPLSAAGQARAQTLVHVTGDAGITGIYATQFLRSQLTVQPLADYLSLPVNEVDMNDIDGLVNQVLSDHGGEVVLITGHSPTIPVIIMELGGDPISPIAEDEYDNLFVVTIYKFGKAKTIHLHYGDPD